MFFSLLYIFYEYFYTAFALSGLVLALIRKDMLRYRHLVLTNLADHAVSTGPRYSARELRTVPTIDVVATRRRADDAAREGRILDARIQRMNWETQLAE